MHRHDANHYRVCDRALKVYQPQTQLNTITSPIFSPNAPSNGLSRARHEIEALPAEMFL